jgi:hypothetical protein
MMGIFRRAFSALLGRQSNSIPTVCYAICSVYTIQLLLHHTSFLELTLSTDNAYFEALSIGKASTLCASNSPFEEDYAACESCLAVNSNDNAQLSNVTSEFQPFIAFCAAQAAGSEVPTSTQLSQAKSSLLAQASSLGLTLGSTLQVTQTVFSIQTVTTSKSSICQISSTSLNFEC